MSERLSVTACPVCGGKLRVTETRAVERAALHRELIAEDQKRTARR